MSIDNLSKLPQLKYEVIYSPLASDIFDNVSYIQKASPGKTITNSVATNKYLQDNHIRHITIGDDTMELVNGLIQPFNQDFVVLLRKESYTKSFFTFPDPFIRILTIPDSPEYRKLVDTIESRGLKEPIWNYSQLVLRRKNRNDIVWVTMEDNTIDELKLPQIVRRPKMFH